MSRGDSEELEDLVVVFVVIVSGFDPTLRMTTTGNRVFDLRRTAGSRVTVLGWSGWHS